MIHDYSEDKVMKATSLKQIIAFLVFEPEVVENLCQVMVGVHLSADWLKVFEVFAPFRPYRLD